MEWSDARPLEFAFCLCAQPPRAHAQTRTTQPTQTSRPIGPQVRPRVYFFASKKLWRVGTQARRSHTLVSQACGQTKDQVPKQGRERGTPVRSWGLARVHHLERHRARVDEGVLGKRRRRHGRRDACARLERHHHRRALVTARVDGNTVALENLRHTGHERGPMSVCAERLGFES